MSVTREQQALLRVLGDAIQAVNSCFAALEDAGVPVGQAIDALGLAMPSGMRAMAEEHIGGVPSSPLTEGAS